MHFSHVIANARGIVLEPIYKTYDTNNVRIAPIVGAY